MNINDDHVVLNRWKKRYNNLYEKTRKEIDELSAARDNHECEKYQLLKIKRSYKYPEKGDVFVIQPRCGLYFYGLVINASINNLQGQDMYVVAIFKLRTSELNDNRFTTDYSNLMLPPMMVDRFYWTKGMFYNVGHIDDLGSIPSYGFYRHYYNHRFWNEFDEKINECPEYLSIGAATITGVGYKVNQELIIDKSLLDFNDKNQ